MEKERQGGRMPKIPDERQEQKAWLMEQIQCLSNRYEEDVLKLRREIHREPELAFRDFKTAEKSGRPSARWALPCVPALPAPG